MNKALTLLACAGYVACVVLANVLTDHLGLVPIGFGLLVTAGTFAAGGALLTRNVVQDVAGFVVVVALMISGCALSWWLASPMLAVASAAAFLMSESVDMLAFTLLRRRRSWPLAIATAALVSATVDTLVFLHVAQFPITAGTVAGQLVVKIGISWFVALMVAVATARPRES